MDTLAQLIPGLNDAEGKFRDELMEGFLGVEPRICGVVDVLPYTPQMYLELEAAGNAFALNTVPNPEDVAIFLWRISPQFSRDAVELRQFFTSAIGLLEFERSAVDCFEYIRRAWSGMPQWKTKKNNRAISVGVWPSRIVHMFADAYGWDETYILNLPFRRLWQYANRILEANDPEYAHKAPEVLRMRAEWLKNRRIERQRARPPS